MLDRAAAEVNSAKPCIFELVATLRQAAGGKGEPSASDVA
jgi:hypothetical protein